MNPAAPSKNDAARSLAIVGAYLVAVVLGGALLAPPLYHATRGIAWLAQFEFQKFFDRAILVCAVLFLIPVAMLLRIRSRAELGLVPNPRALADCAVGFLVAFSTIALLGVILVQQEVYRWKADLPWGGLGKIALSAVVVSLLEEALFRGALLGLARRAFGSVAALIATSALFSSVHFIRPPDEEIAGPVVWTSGLSCLGDAFWQFREPALLLAGFSTLLLVGIILAWTTERTRSLWVAIGLHAGWIIGTMGFSKFTKRLRKDTLPWFGEDLTVGIGSLITVGVAGVLIYFWLRRRQTSIPESNAP